MILKIKKKGKHYVALCGELALQDALDLS